MYSPFNQFQIRIPRFSFNSLKEESFEAKVQDPQVQEAIYLASPVLYAELQKYLTGTVTNNDEKRRIESSLYKYISRMSSRCTPFGLFAGCSVGKITGDKTHIVLGNPNRHTRLDMFFLCTLSQELSKLPEIREKVKYYPNSTLYPVGKKYRYVEYQYKGNRRIHQISSVDRSSYLNTMIEMVRGGVKASEMLAYLVESRIEQDDAKEFIKDLIDSQIIVSELSPSVTGDDYFTRIIQVLEKMNVDKTILLPLKEIEEILYQLDADKKDNIKLYRNIIQKIKEINIPYEEKFLFQVDMIRNIQEAVLGKNIVNELQSTMAFLNKITNRSKNEGLNQFQQAFYSRYEEKEVSLMEALDPEIGIGYPANKAAGDITPLLENFFIPGQTNQEMNYHSSPFLSILLKKTMEVLKQGKNEVVFFDDDVKDFKTNWEDLPPTMYSMFEILESDFDNLLIKTNGIYGTCGANLMARFAHTEENIAQFVNEIAAKEQELMPDALLAEIAHLPDSRVGNVLCRPHIRDYELLYLASSDLPENRQIYMSDLYLSIRQGKICLRSKKLGKEIIPRLTNAHNYHSSSMPVYRFLCDIQMQHGRSGLQFNWGYLNNELSFLPRVRYKNTILSLATWKIKTAEMKHLFALKDDNQLLVETKEWREKYPLPQKMLLSDGDNELLIDWDNVQSIRSLFSVIKKRGMITLTEFLYDPDHSVVRDEAGNPYPNECIVVFYQNQKK
jgi:hypothetical protein